VIKLDLHYMFVFGQRLQAISTLKQEDKVRPRVLDLHYARDSLEHMVGPDSPLLATSKRAAQKLLESIKSIIPGGIVESLSIPDDRAFSYQAWSITTPLEELKSVLGNDMPDISSFVTSAKGIYKTDELISRPERHLSEDVQRLLSGHALLDIREAGKCLAFELPTACAFHLWRVVESVMDTYQMHLTGQSFKDSGVKSNWGNYIEALKKAGGENKICVFLDHIRGSYRNPQTHPDEIITVEEARRLFAVAMSAIDQVLRATLTPATPSTP